MIYLIIYLLGFCATIAIMVLLVDKDVVETSGEGVILSAAVWPVTLTIIFFIVIFKQIL